MMTHPDILQPTKTLSQNINLSIKAEGLILKTRGTTTGGNIPGSYQPSIKFLAREIRSCDQTVNPIPV